MQRSPAADAAAVLISLGVSVEISGPLGKMVLPVEEFFLGPGQTVLKRGDILSGIILPSPAPCSAYQKLGSPKDMEIAVVSVAVALVMEGELINKCRVGLTAVTPIPLRALLAEAALKRRGLGSPPKLSGCRSGCRRRIQSPRLSSKPRLCIDRRQSSCCCSVLSSRSGTEVSGQSGPAVCLVDWW